MPCYHPLKAYYRYREDGKKDIKFVSDNSMPVYQDSEHIYPFPISIPCGQCIGCRLEYSRQWAIRCVLESARWPRNIFITLTYDDDHLPEAVPLADPVTGEVQSLSPLHSLSLDDIQKFFKRLRVQCQREYDFTGIRVFYCGEYGSTTYRPHYHAILFNVPDFDLTFYKQNFNGDLLYNCDFLSRVWGKGFVVVGKVNFCTCAYVARYILKKQKGHNSSIYPAVGILPEFSNQSRRPGIGRSYYDEHRDQIYTYDSFAILGKDDLPLEVKPPKYFDRLYGVDDPVAMEELKRQRAKIAESAHRIRLSNTSLSESDLFAQMEQSLRLRVNGLTRPLG